MRFTYPINAGVCEVRIKVLSAWEDEVWHMEDRVVSVDGINLILSIHQHHVPTQEKRP